MQLLGSPIAAKLQEAVLWGRVRVAQLGRRQMGDLGGHLRKADHIELTGGEICWVQASQIRGTGELVVGMEDRRGDSGGGDGMTVRPS